MNGRHYLRTGILDFSSGCQLDVKGFTQAATIIAIGACVKFLSAN